MLFVPVEHLKDGMVLAQSVNLTIGGIPLLAKGEVLKDYYIRKLQTMNLIGLYIETDYSSDIEIKSMIDDKLKKQALTELKHTFEDYSQTNKFTYSTVTSIANIAKNLVMDIMTTDEVLINVVELKGYDEYTYQHSLSVAIIAITIGIKLGLNESDLNQLALSGLLHDLGKMQIPKEIINKPAKLTEQEFEIVKMHPISALSQLQRLHSVSTVSLKGIESHHERYDGKGYPNKLKGAAIPLFGRILAIADVYDALTSDRPYRKAGFPNEIIEYMMGNADTHFDIELLTCFIKSVAAYPTGMLVRLSDGRGALVVKNNEDNTLRPVVRLFSGDGASHTDIDLLHDRQYHNITIVGTGYADEMMRAAMGGKNG